MLLHSYMTTKWQEEKNGTQISFTTAPHLENKKMRQIVHRPASDISTALIVLCPAMAGPGHRAMGKTVEEYL